MDLELKGVRDGSGRLCLEKRNHRNREGGYHGTCEGEGARRPSAELWEHGHVRSEWRRTEGEGSFSTFTRQESKMTWSNSLRITLATERLAIA